MMHSVTTNLNEIKINLENIISVINKISKNYFVFSFLPNTDPGCNFIIKKLKRNSNVKIISNLDSSLFLELMKNSCFMIGNSSSGIREAPTFKIPYLCIGSRQNGRERSVNVIDVNYSENEILTKIKYINENKNFKNKLKKCKNVYGTGNVAKKMFKILEKININDNVLEKKFSYYK